MASDDDNDDNVNVNHYIILIEKPKALRAFRHPRIWLISSRQLIKNLMDAFCCLLPPK